jgi:hypothetical protein
LKKEEGILERKENRNTLRKYPLEIFDFLEKLPFNAVHAEISEWIIRELKGKSYTKDLEIRLENNKKKFLLTKNIS